MIRSPPKLSSWSNRLCESRIDPAARRATSSRAGWSTSNPSASAMLASRRMMFCTPTVAKSNRCTRLRIVSGSLFGSVVQNTNFTPPGGSSKVFSSALNAALESMWTSSMM